MTGLGQASVRCVILADKHLYISMLVDVFTPPRCVAEGLHSVDMIVRHADPVPES